MVRRSRKKKRTRKRRGGEPVWAGVNGGPGGSCEKFKDKVTKFTDDFSKLKKKCSNLAGVNCPELCKHFKGLISPSNTPVSNPQAPPTPSILPPAPTPSILPPAPTPSILPPARLSPKCAYPPYAKENPGKCGNPQGVSTPAKENPGNPQDGSTPAKENTGNPQDGSTPTKKMYPCTTESWKQCNLEECRQDSKADVAKRQGPGYNHKQYKRFRRCRPKKGGRRKTNRRKTKRRKTKRRRTKRRKTKRRRTRKRH